MILKKKKLLEPFDPMDVVYRLMPPCAPGEDNLFCSGLPSDYSQYLTDKDRKIVQSASEVLSRHIGDKYGALSEIYSFTEYICRSRMPKTKLGELRKKFRNISRKIDDLISEIEFGINEDHNFFRAADLAWYESNREGYFEDEIYNQLNAIKDIFEQASSILPPQPAEKSKYDTYPISFSAPEKLVWDLAWFFAKKFKLKNNPMPVWKFAREGMAHKNRAENTYSGPFYDLVKDIWQVLEIKDWKENLGQKTEQALYKLRDISEQICATEKVVKV